MTDETLIIDQTITPRYFAMVPYLIDDMGLSVYAVRLYLRILRRVGNNSQCWENTRNLAAGCSMSIGKVSQAKKELEQNGLITVNLKDNNRGEFPYHEITIDNIWRQNIEKYSTCSQHEQDPAHQVNRTVSPHEPKDNPLKDYKRKGKKARTSLAHIPPPSNANAFSGGVNQSSISKSHPAIQAVKSACGYYPPKLIYQEVVNLIGENPTNEVILEMTKCAKTWVANRHSPMTFSVGYLIGTLQRNITCQNMPKRLITILKNRK